MADSVITPAAQVPTVVGAGGQQTQSATDTTTRPPGLPAGTTVSGTIAGRDASGNFLLKSAQGTFALKSDTPLTYNSDVVIRLGSGTSGAGAARIVSVNGESYADFAAPEPETTDSVSQSPQAQAAQPAQDSAAQPAVVRATVVATPFSTEQQSANATLTPGNTVGLRVTPQAGEPSTPSAPTLSAAAQESVPTVTGNQAVQAAPEAAGMPLSAGSQAPPAVTESAEQPSSAQTGALLAQAAPAAASASALASTAVVEPAPTVATPATTAPSAPASASYSPPAAEQTQSAPQQIVQESTATPVSLLYNAYAKQSSAVAATPVTPAPTAAMVADTAQAQPSPPISAQVVSAAQDGTVQLQTPLGAVTVQTAASPPATLTAGAAVTLQSIAAESTQPGAPAADIAELAGSWQTLKDITDLEETFAPAGGKAGLLARLPQLGPEFVSDSLGLITSLLQGNTNKLLGDDTVESLRQGGRQDLLEKFTAEAASIAQAYNAPAQKQQADWQMLFLPFVFQEALQQARIYVKRDAPKKDRVSANASPETRFVVEVDLSELGGIQMDGLVRKKEQTVAFDLIVRSHSAFDGEEQKAILAIYNEAAGITGFKGSLVFQVTRDFPVKPLEEVRGRDITA